VARHAATVGEGADARDEVSPWVVQHPRPDRGVVHLRPVIDTHQRQRHHLRREARPLRCATGMGRIA
jgi:hypothetical protein